jgi:hypothetical protein
MLQPSRDLGAPLELDVEPSPSHGRGSSSVVDSFGEVSREIADSRSAPARVSIERPFPVRTSSEVAVTDTGNALVRISSYSRWN